MDMLEHPIITNVECTGYADGIDPAYPHCPCCGEVCETVYRDRYGAYIGCNECLTTRNAWEVEVCFPDMED